MLLRTPAHLLCMLTVGGREGRVRSRRKVHMKGHNVIRSAYKSVRGEFFGGEGGLPNVSIDIRFVLIVVSDSI